MQAWLDEEGIEADEVIETDLRRYLVKVLPNLVGENTAETEGRHVKSAYRNAAEDGLIGERVVTRRVKVPKANTPEPMPYSHDNLRRLRAAVVDEVDDLIFTLFVYTGTRRCELAALRWSDVEFGEAIIRVQGKGGKRRLVPMHPLVSRVLQSHVKRTLRCFSGMRGPVDPESVVGRSMRNVNDRFRRMLLEAGLDPDESNRPLHRIRKTAATSLRREGVHPEVIDRIFGWSPQTTRTKYYSGVDDDELHEAIRKLYRSDPIERPVTAPDPEPQPKRTRRAA
jgi:integrase